MDLFYSVSCSVLESIMQAKWIKFGDGDNEVDNDEKSIYIPLIKICVRQFLFGLHNIAE